MVQRPPVIVLFDLISMLAGISVDDPPIEFVKALFSRDATSRAMPGVIPWILREWMERCGAVDSTPGRDQVDKKLWIVLILTLTEDVFHQVVTGHGDGRDY